ncbi:lambda-crystallin-like isoform X2 [Gigantopelta aegis]|uniref:lambda-crystallin-like isoform X2 n=1 Tax=Gigantopelta aegis TaxID=1735272 RepID=UPI001B88DE0E|nr:lambda-crystallin-like isoform X2 [Gigantopelta aegis]
MEDINHQLQHLSENGLGKGSLTPDQQYSRISTAERLDVCVSEAILVMECVPEVLDLKREVWLDIDRHVQGETSLASSSSAIQPSLLSSDMEHRENFVVTHPINPPFYIPLVEIVRAPWTSDKTVDMVYKLMEDIGQAPVVLQKEIFNFVAARIQNACLQEAWWLIKDSSVTCHRPLSCTAAHRNLSENRNEWAATQPKLWNANWSLSHGLARFQTDAGGETKDWQNCPN